MAWTQKADLKGTAGDDGDDGDPGTQWFTGEGAPTSVPTSVTGDYYLDTLTGHLYVLEA
jgi:hypothetical protein